MTRLRPSEAIRHHHARGMSRARLIEIYGRDDVLRVLGSEEPVKVIEPRRKAFHERLEDARIAKGHGRPHASRVIGCSEEGLTRYEQGTSIPRKTQIIASIAKYMGEKVIALSDELEREAGKLGQRAAVRRAISYERVAG